MREAALTVCLTASLLAPVLTGGLEAPLALAVLLPCLLAPWLRGVSERLPWRPALLVGGVVIAVAVGRGMPPDAGLGAWLALMIAHQRLGPAPERYDRVALLMGVLLLVGTAARSRGLAFLPVTLAWMIAAPIALWEPMRGTFGSARNLARLRMTVGTVVLTCALFVALPRLAGGGAAPEAETGLTEALEAGSFDQLADDPRVVAELRYEHPPAGPVRLRAAALDLFDRRSWTSSVAARPVARFASGARWRVRVEQPDLGRTLLLPGPVARWVEGGEGRVQDVSDVWRSTTTGPANFSVEIGLDGLPVVPLLVHEVARYLQLPEGLDPRVHELAEQLVAGRSGSEERLAAVVEHLSTRYEYSRTNLRSQGDPLVRFLFEARYGHCEYFASATAVLLRLAGVPARVITGFAGGEPIEGGWRFRGTDAHAWVEAWLPERGWVLIDTTLGVAARELSMAPAPSGLPAPIPVPAWKRPLPTLERWWERDVVGFAAGHQQALLTRVDLVRPSWWWLLLPLAWLGLRAWSGRPIVAGQGSIRPGRSRDEVATALQTALAQVAEQVPPAPPALPPLDAAQWYAARWGEGLAPLVQLAWLHYEVAYGGAPTDERLEDARRLVASISTWRPPPPGGEER
jgi:transglutaminase-like putative cysteine protease